MRTVLVALLLVAVALPVGAIEFKPYRDNYIGFMWNNPQDDGAAENQVNYTPQLAKLQVSFATSIIELPNFWTHLWMGYTQKSFWDILGQSSPFKEHDFNPELFLEWTPDLWKMDSWQVGYEHESNGVAGEDSRSWDRTYVSSTVKASWRDFHFTATPKIWWVLDTGGENADIGSTSITGIGIDELGGSLRVWAEFRGVVVIDAEVWSHEGTAQLKFQDDDWAKYYGFLQVYRGKGDSLIDYGEYSTTVLAGIALGK
jgi:phospholipase A1